MMRYAISPAIALSPTHALWWIIAHRGKTTVGGNLIHYPYGLSTRTADLTTTKIMWNRVISTPGSRYITSDVKNFYLEIPMDRYEYMRMPLKLIPDKIIDLYQLRDKAKGEYEYMEIQKGMYGLSHAGILANTLLHERLATHGYHELQDTPGVWTH